MRRFFADPERFNGNRITLGEEETRHLRDVLRMKPEESAQIFDGEGREVLARISTIGKRETFLEVIEEIPPAAPESDLDLTLAVTAFKNDKVDLVVQKAVELGVARLVPIVSFRSEVKLRDAAKRTGRWQKIALEATKQCERAKVMTIEEPKQFDEFVSVSSQLSGTLLMFSEKDGRAIPSEIVEKKITALVGPKGGWDDFEIELAAKRGFIPVKLGRRIMRAETAAITFSGVLQHLFGDLN
jgi:16S rRNA (uracil1498-N3)-methyltransferase